MQSIKIVIPDYIRKVKLSEKQLPIYYEYKNNRLKAKNKDVPLRYIKFESRNKIILNEGKLDMNDIKEGYSIKPFDNNKITNKANAKWFLCDTKFERIIANPLKVGKPRIKVINAQDIFSGKTQSFEKENLMMAIKKSFAPFIQHLKPITEYPVRIRLYIFDTVKNEFDRSLQDDSGTRWDLINRSYFYMKAFADLLVEGLKDRSMIVPKILIDDERLYVTEDGGAVFCPIDKAEKKRLVFIIAKDDEHFNDAIKDIESERQYLLKNNRWYKELNKNND